MLDIQWWPRRSRPLLRPTRLRPCLQTHKTLNSSAGRLRRSPQHRRQPAHLTSLCVSTLVCIWPLGGPWPDSDHTLVELSTLITVQHFSDYYGIPPSSFDSPHYLRLGDGSLIATPLIRDMSGAHVSLFVIGLAFCFFLGNTVTSLGYILGGKIKHKVLLYMLFTSQLLASATYISLFAGYMDDRVNCTVLVYLGAQFQATRLRFFSPRRLIMLSQIWIVLSQGILVRISLTQAPSTLMNSASRYPAFSESKPIDV
jgi:hypothetical protein